MRILLLAVAITTSLSYTFPHHLPNSVALYERKKGKKGKTSVGGFGGLIKNIKQQQFSFTGSITPGMQTVQNPTPPTLPPSSIPEYAKSSHPLTIDDVRPWIVTPKTPEQISKMEISGRIARQVLDFGGSLVRPGITTDEIDQAVHELTIELGAYPSPLNYHKFPKSCCTSVNEIVCHGIPDDRKLVAGDIINLDITIYNDGYHGDCSEMFIVGERSDVPKRSQELIQATYDCWLLACKFVKPGNLYRDIGEIIEDYVTEKQFSTVKGFCGHGIGSIFHCNPNILHYKNDQPNGSMEAGHTFTIEPMICEGGATTVTWPDEWTAATKDGGRSAQFEHTLLITENGVRPLTGKLPTSKVQFWEEESLIHKGVWLGEG